MPVNDKKPMSPACLETITVAALDSIMECFGKAIRFHQEVKNANQHLL